MMNDKFHTSFWNHPEKNKFLRTDSRAQSSHSSFDQSAQSGNLGINELKSSRLSLLSSTSVSFFRRHNFIFSNAFLTQDPFFDMSSLVVEDALVEARSRRGKPSQRDAHVMSICSSSSSTTTFSGKRKDPSGRARRASFQQAFISEF